MIERLHHADHVVSAQEKIDEQLSGFVGPRIGQRVFEFDRSRTSLDEGIKAAWTATRNGMIGSSAAAPAESVRVSSTS